MNLSVFKAQRLTSRSEETESLTISATVEFPECQTLVDAADLHNRAGTELASALFNHLPGGTIDAIIAEMLRRRASLFAVRFGA